jgi:hypothetical protein
MTPGIGTVAEVEDRIATGAEVAIVIEEAASRDQMTAISTIPTGRHHHARPASALIHLALQMTSLWIDLLVVPPALPRAFAIVDDQIIIDLPHPAT